MKNPGGVAEKLKHRSSRFGGPSEFLLTLTSIPVSTTTMHGSPTPRGTPSRRGRSPRSTTSQSSSNNNNLPPEFSTINKASATFTSCLSIAVQGAVPVERLEPHSSSSADSASIQVANGELKRLPRKSKANALEALHNHAQSSMGQEDIIESPSEDVGIRIQLRDGPPIRVSSALDMSTVKTPFPRKIASPVAERPFGLTDCPTFYPTPEQFKDPMSYIQSISEAGKEYGMCKIVPPLGWDMPFVTDTEVCLPAVARVHLRATELFTAICLQLSSFSILQRFRFKTRLQQLNSIEASSRAKVNFLEALYRFHKQQGNSRVSVPTINFKSLDLWLLRKEVDKLGGFDAVCSSIFHSPCRVLTTHSGHQSKEMGRSWPIARLHRHSWTFDAAEKFVCSYHPTLRTFLRTISELTVDVTE